MYERIGGFEQSREPHPAYLNADASQIHTIMDDWGGVINSGPVTHWPDSSRRSLQDCEQHSKVPVKVSVGAGPANLAWHVHFKHYKTPKELSFALAPIFNKEMKDLVAAGAQVSAVRGPRPVDGTFTGNKDDFKWVRESVEMCCDGVNAKIGWHFCFGNAVGQRHPERQLP
jgi:hypothetical protein